MLTIVLISMKAQAHWFYVLAPLIINLKKIMSHFWNWSRKDLFNSWGPYWVLGNNRLFFNCPTPKSCKCQIASNQKSYQNLLWGGAVKKNLVFVCQGPYFLWTVQQWVNSCYSSLTCLWLVNSCTIIVILCCKEMLYILTFALFSHRIGD